MAPPKKKGQTLSLHELHSLIPSGTGPTSSSSMGMGGVGGGSGNWADEEIELPSAPMALDSSSASSRYSGGGSGSMGGGPGERAIGRFPSSGGAPGGHRGSRDLNAPPAPYVPNLAELPTSPPFTAFVGNLSYDTSEADIRRFFDGITLQSIRLPMQDGRPRGTAFVEFTNQDGLVKGLLKNGAILNGRYPRIDIAQGRGGGGDYSGEPRAFAGNWRDTPHEVVSSSRGEQRPGFASAAPPRSNPPMDRTIDRSKFVPVAAERPQPAGSWRETAKPVVAETIKPAPAADAGRPKLNLLPPSSKPASSTTEPRLAPEYAQKSPKSNPFGAARPREQVIAERKDVDE